MVRLLSYSFAFSFCKLQLSFLQIYFKAYARRYELMWTRATSASRSLSLICNGNLAFSHSVFTIDPVCFIAKQCNLRFAIPCIWQLISLASLTPDSRSLSARIGLQTILTRTLQFPKRFALCKIAKAITLLAGPYHPCLFC